MNIKVRIKNPVFWFQIALTIITTATAYLGITGQDITTWPALGNVLLQIVSNPYMLVLVIVSIWNAVNDPTTPGIKDSTRALTYTKPGQ